MSVARFVRLSAAGAAALGLFSFATGETWAAALAGLCAMVTAGLVLGRWETPTTPGHSEPPRDEPDEEPTPTEVVVPVVPAPEHVETVDGPALAVDSSGNGPVLMGGDFLDATLRGRVAVARRALRPLSVVHVEILAEPPSGSPVSADRLAMAAAATLRESDVVGRRDDGVYVFILEDTAEDGAVWTAERLRRYVIGTLGPSRFHAGVASYPNHGLDAESIGAKAAGALHAARDWGRDRIEVATAH